MLIAVARLSCVGHALTPPGSRRSAQSGPLVVCESCSFLFRNLRLFMNKLLGVDS